jgi:DnaJ like chaperone protein
MLWFVIIGSLLGYAAAGPLGLPLGAVAGFLAGLWTLRVVLPGGGIQGQFLDTTFAVMGAVCKADGRVCRDEIAVAERYFDTLALSREQREAARAAFNRGKCVGFDLYREVSELRGLLRYNRTLLQLFLQIQLSAVAANGGVHENEHRILLRIAHALGLSEADVEALEAMLRSRSAGPDVPRDKVCENAYAVLGLEPAASDAEVRKAYRRLMSRYHPDKFEGRGLPENVRKVARERVLEVRKAYDTIRQQRAQARKA